jgi:hypothetical protein
MSLKISLIILFLNFSFSVSNTFSSNAFGIVVDSKGYSNLIRDNVLIKINFGQELMIGDIIEFSDGAKITLVGYKNCEEWNLSSPIQVIIKTDTDILTETDKILPTRTLPACYQPESYISYTAYKIGGTVLRGRPDTINDQEIAKIRRSAESGRASNSELIGLITHDINKGMKNSAQKYYYQLLKQNPNAQLPFPLMQLLE